MNFTLAILLLIAFIGSGAFFLVVSQDLSLERVESQPVSAPATDPADFDEE